LLYFVNLVDEAKSIPVNLAETLILTPLSELSKGLTNLLVNNNIHLNGENRNSKVVKFIESLNIVIKALLKKDANIQFCLAKLQNDFKEAVGGIESEE
jgi:hypothetical protein